MPTIKALTMIVHSLCFAFILAAQPPEGYKPVADDGSLKSRIREVSAATQSISSDFIQEKQLTMMEEVLISRGRFFFRKENHVKWEYLEPIRYTILIMDDRFMINNDGKVSEFDSGSNRLFREINKMIIMAIQGNFVDSQDFDAAFYEHEQAYLARLKPENELLRDMLTLIEIRFSKPDMQVTEVRFVEPGEDFTLITFENRRTNTEIPDDQFRFTE